MGIEALLLPGGLTLAVVLFWIALYKGLFSPPTPVTASAQSTGGAKQAVTTPAYGTVEPANEARTRSQIEVPIQEDVQPIVAIPTHLVAVAPVTEAPPPFEEPETAFTNLSTASTPLPTDTTAVTNIANPVANIAPVLVIAKPKRIRRTTKRLPIDGAPKRKRAVRAKPEITTPAPVTMPAPESMTATGQQSEVS